MRIFEKDNLIQFVVRFYTFGGTLINVDTGTIAKITIKNSTGNVIVDNANLSSISTGKYGYRWTTATADKYRVEISGTVQARTMLMREVFLVEETEI